MSDEWVNRLYFGDNLDVLREHVDDGSVDLIYLDPPFNSKATYNVLFDEKNGTASTAQIEAFEDTWHWGEESEATYQGVVTNGPQRLADLMEALRHFLGENDVMAYLTMMAVRLAELHRVLSGTGCIYLHCDPTASHYLKLLMDAVFSPRCFRNEIAWCYQIGGRVSRRAYGRRHDILLFYTKSDEYSFNWDAPEVMEPWSETGAAKFKYKDEKGRYRLMGRFLKGSPIKGHRDVSPDWEKKRPELVYRHYMKEGRMCLDYWNISPINQASKERLGYPTQKPQELLERIVAASSNKGDIVLDPFCGCGTTIAAAERLGRRWMGIDVTHLAITLIRHRLRYSLGDDPKAKEFNQLAPYDVVGVPADVAGAEALALDHRHKFELWALGLVGARPGQDKRGADKGIDGWILFFDADEAKAKRIVVSVKSGHVTVSQVRDLKGVMEREKAEMGAFITLRPPTKPMLREAVTAGFYQADDLGGTQWPRLQILTVEELLSGAELRHPRSSATTFRRPQRQRRGRTVQREMFETDD